MEEVMASPNLLLIIEREVDLEKRIKKNWLGTPGNRTQVSGLPVQYGKCYTTWTLHHSCFQFNDNYTVTVQGNLSQPPQKQNCLISQSFLLPYVIYLRVFPCLLHNVIYLWVFSLSFRLKGRQMTAILRILLKALHIYQMLNKVKNA